MIWLLLLILVAGVGCYLLLPYLSLDGDRSREDALAEARAQLAILEADAAEGRINAEMADTSRQAIERRVLDLLDRKPIKGVASQLRGFSILAVPAVLVLGTVGLYLQVGAPNFQPMTTAEFRAAQDASAPQSLEELVVTLSSRLEADPAPPFDGYVLLARSYMTLGRFDAGLAAYDRAVALSDNLPDVLDERERARAYVAQLGDMPAIDPEVMERIQSMSAEQQAEMIESMVDGLAARLEADPMDLNGWQRLIRARLVMSDFDKALRDLDTARAAFAGDAQAISDLNSFAVEVGLLQSSDD